MRRRAVEKEGTFFGAVGLESPACFFREPSPSSSPCTFRLSVECHQFLIELSVRPSRSLAICAQLLPCNSTPLSIPFDRKMAVRTTTGYTPSSGALQGRLPPPLPSKVYARQQMRVSAITYPANHRRPSNKDWHTSWHRHTLF